MVDLNGIGQQIHGRDAGVGIDATVVLLLPQFEALQLLLGRFPAEVQLFLQIGAVTCLLRRPPLNPPSDLVPLVGGFADLACEFDDDAAGSGAEMMDQRLHRSEEHTSELQSLMRISYAVFCLK